MLFLSVHRILLQNFKVYSSQKDDVQWHINSKYSEEMSAKSQVVSNSMLQVIACYN